MKSCHLSLIVVVYLLSTSAWPQDVKQVIEAEKAFAAYALEKNTRDAFLRFMDSAAVVFDKGEILEARTVWTAMPVSADKLLWKPAFAGISRSGDLAFTTGPWEYKPAAEDTSVASGEFATIWIKTGGEWKFLVDLGISAPQRMNSYKIVRQVRKGIGSDADSLTIVKVEAQLNQLIAKDGTEAIVNSAADNCWYMMNNYVPLRGIAEIKSKIKTITPQDLIFQPAVSGIATSGDLGYTYGYVAYNKKTENYLRVWQNTRKGWKMILSLVK